MTTKTVELSPPMQVKLWTLAMVEAGASARPDGVPTHLRRNWRRRTAQRTMDALRNRGLIFWSSSRMRHTLTDTGRAWITEQIEAARREAVKQHAMTLTVGEATRFLVRSGLFGRQYSLPAVMVEHDHAEARRENYWRDNTAMVISPCRSGGAWTAHGEQWCEWLARAAGDPFADPSVDQLDAMLVADHIDAIRERLDRARAVEGFMATDEYQAARAAAQAAELFPQTMALR